MYSSASESNEALAFDMGRTPSPTTAPATPKSIGHPSPPVRKDSWDLNGGREDWDYITVGKRYSPGDVFTLPSSISVTPLTLSRPGTRQGPDAQHPLAQAVSHSDHDLPLDLAVEEDIKSSNAAEDDEDWVCDTPQVVVARSVSVTRANSNRLMVRPVRSSSRAGLHVHSFNSSSTTSSSVTSPISTVSSTTSVGSSIDDRHARILARKNELRREIWGTSRIEGTEIVNSPGMRLDVKLVSGAEERRSVLAVIESI
jgi:hypothetical protein